MIIKNMFEKFLFKEKPIVKKENKIEEENNEGKMSRRDFLKLTAVASIIANVPVLAHEIPKGQDKAENPPEGEPSQHFDTSFIHETKEKKPFLESPAQNFFVEWCKVNDSITPEFIPRENWSKTENENVFKKNNQGGYTLLMPEDLQLWEMMNFIKTIDHNTFAQKPESQDYRSTQILELGKTFEKAALYLKQYLPNIQEGKEIAETIINEFYSYGLSLQQKNRINKVVDKKENLSPEDKQKLDEWFLGSNSYQKRMDLLGNNLDTHIVEEKRIKLLQIYFKSLTKQGYHGANIERPWETIEGPTQHIQRKSKEQIIKAIETPEREFKTSIFVRGVEFLKNGMGFDKLFDILDELERKQEQHQELMTTDDKDNLKLLRNFKSTIDFWKKQNYKTLYEAINIPNLKAELKSLRGTFDQEKISQKELEITETIQKLIGSLPYKLSSEDAGDPAYPAKIVEKQFINCVGSSVLASAFLDELGIRHLHSTLEDHSILFVLSSDNKVHWRDFTPMNECVDNHEIRENEIFGKNFSGGILRPSDIVEFASHPKDNRGLCFEIKNQATEDKPSRINLCRPEIGLQCAILYILGNKLDKLEKYEEAIKAYQQAIELNPQYTNPLSGLGMALRNLGKNEEAVEIYKKAISLSPKDSYFYYNLGSTLNDLQRTNEAINAYQQAIKLNPNDALLRFGFGNILKDQGKNKEAIESYKKFIELWDGDKDFIEAIEGLIAEIS